MQSGLSTAVKLRSSQLQLILSAQKPEAWWNWDKDDFCLTKHKQITPNRQSICYCAPHSLKKGFLTLFYISIFIDLRRCALCHCFLYRCFSFSIFPPGNSSFDSQPFCLKTPWLSMSKSVSLRKCVIFTRVHIARLRKRRNCHVDIARPYLIFVISFTLAGFSKTKFYTQKND